MTIYQLLFNRLILFIIHFSVFSVAKNLFVPQCLCGYQSIMQNKPNFRNAQIVVNLVKTRNYNNEQRTMNYSKQTQSNPIYGEQTRPKCSRRGRTTCSELVEPISKWRKPCLTAGTPAQDTLTSSYKPCPLSRSFPSLHNWSQTSCGNWPGGLIAKTPVGPPESAPRPRRESSSSAVSLSRFLNAFIALLSTSGVMPPPCSCCWCSVIICRRVFTFSAIPAVSSGLCRRNRHHDCHRRRSRLVLLCRHGRSSALPR